MPARTIEQAEGAAGPRPVNDPSASAKGGRAPQSPVKKEDKSKALDTAELKDYQLGDCLGKGAFGSVYRALNWGTGETVAIKQIKLANLPKSELRVIMLEIDLLKNLDHPNIVKYHGFVNTPDTLNIILEYCENGSLHSISKNFGRFPENLVGLYMSQTLHGLLYLHEQGVIHRDIKGANILTTKQGLVKLADFGVASRTTGLHESSVVGTPYWMAPEVIELTGATTASDIWSLGCTVIELLDGRPPYYNLQPMPALFRIVNDDHPPLPQGASPLVVDFLMQCFQKDPNLRVSAKKLLKHPWIVNARRSDSVVAKNSTEYTEAVKSVQEWNEALKDSPNGNRTSKASRTSSASPIPGLKDGTRPGKSPGVPTLPIVETKIAPEKFSSADDDNDNWDDDFVTAIPPTALQLPHLRPQDNFGGMLSSDRLKAYASIENALNLQNQPGDDDKSATVKSPVQPTVSDGLKTVRPAPIKRTGVKHTRHTSEVPKPRTKPVQTPRKTSLPSSRQGNNAANNKSLPTKPLDTNFAELFRESATDDFSELIISNDVDLDERFNKLRLQNEDPSPMLGPRKVPALVNSIRPPTAGGSLHRPPPPRSKISMRRTRSSIEIQRYAENKDDEDFSDVLGDNGDSLGAQQASDGSPINSLMLNSKTSNPSVSGERDDEFDPFFGLIETLPDMDLESSADREIRALSRTDVAELVGQLMVAGNDDTLLHITQRLMNHFNRFPETKAVIISAHGVLPILEILEEEQDSLPHEIILNLLKIINAVIIDNEKVQENLCFVGGIPTIIKFAAKKFPREIRLEAATFVQQMYLSTPLMLQLFVSAGGLKVLVDFLEDDYDDDRKLVLIGVDGISRVFETPLPASTPKNDFCRILSRNSVLEPLSLVLTRVLDESAASGDQRELAESYEGRIAGIFSFFSQAEIYVKQLVAQRTVLHRVLKNLKRMSPPHRITMLKFIKNLSQLQATLQTLHNSNAIDVLTELLSNGMNQPHFRELSNQILITIYNLCRVAQSCREEAALNGIIPILIKICNQDKARKEITLPILCAMADSGPVARRELWQNKGLAFYVSLLTDANWRVSALEAISRWLRVETSRVQDHLLENQNFTEAIVYALSSSGIVTFESILILLNDLLRIGTEVAKSMARSVELFKIIEQNLRHNKPGIRLNLLGILVSICAAADDGGFLHDKDDLYKLVYELQFVDSTVTVRSMAQELIRSCDESDNISMHSGHGGSGGQPSGRRKLAGAMRRTSSSTTPPHLLERQMSMPTSPQLGRSERASMGFFDPPAERIAQTPRRQRNGVTYTNGSSVIRPVSRDGATYIRDGSPALTVPPLQRANTATAAVGEPSMNKSRLPRTTPAQRPSKTPVRVDAGVLSNSKEDRLNSPTPISSSAITEARRKENAHASGGYRNRAVEVTVASSARRTMTRRHGDDK